MVWILLILFVAAILQGAVGFGFALVAMPALALVMDAPSAAALVALTGISLSTVMLLQNRKGLHMGEAAGLIVAAAAGVPIGVFLLAHAPRGPLLIALGIIIIAFSVFSLARPSALEIKDRRWRFAAGFAGGILGGAYNIPGPPIIFYGAMRRWPPERFLAVTQAFFLPVAIMIAAGHAVAGFWSRELLITCAASIPGVIIASFIGRRITAGISAEALSKAVYGLCLVLGLVILTMNLGG
ncbi:sulfite exporter TauE/SafE family protein [Marinicaulis aureus]|uniref:Probable membrane transporter protein n=1 Tax=Hyphococcus aureus TaxID=2666033 RepID=A0ABW1KT05_9PROT